MDKRDALSSTVLNYFHKIVETVSNTKEFQELLDKKLHDLLLPLKVKGKETELKQMFEVRTRCLILARAFFDAERFVELKISSHIDDKQRVVTIDGNFYRFDEETQFLCLTSGGNYFVSELEYDEFDSIWSFCDGDRDILFEECEKIWVIRKVT